MTKTPRTYDMRTLNSWGNSIQWQNVEKRRIVGWQDQIPRKGDVILAAMQSGKVGRFLVTKVDPCRDPADMFFATVKDDGYLDAEPR